ncbi:hypothetical protein SD70_27145 [Gordoniibacillus kamchatkensis]|uniref:Large polyvalent protein associated domain-containing protein n=1 Tax=Gordoniibacillus kamchatkensis TaxID=1590651 RepID=A0ABR5AB60_9BACL|nr:hypothetical protein [Paenibacillus sp. VKM B-2647]KIL38295.1 hypothetical protein SD70_27145 [Paenibacillus sp. VKM B-2647]
MGSVFDQMPNFQSFRNSWQSNLPQDNSSNDWNTRTPFSNPVDYSGDSGVASQLNAATNDGGGFFSNLWNGISNSPIGQGIANATSVLPKALETVGIAVGDPIRSLVEGQPVNTVSDISNIWNRSGSQTWSDIGDLYNRSKGALQGAMSGAYSGAPSILQSIGNGGLLGSIGNDVVSIGKGIAQGWENPTTENQSFQQGLNAVTSPLPKSVAWAPRFAAEAVTDPLTYAPIGKVAGIAGRILKVASDAAGATPYITGAVDAIKSTKPVSAVTDALGKAFVKNYGTSDGLSQSLQELQGNIAADRMAIQQHLPQLAQAHGLTPDEVRQLPEVFEAGGSTNPRLHQAYQDLNNILNNGIPLHDQFKIGTNAETSTLFNGKPILDPEKLIQGYYPQRYAKELNPKLQQKMDDLIIGQKKGFSTSGPFNQERLFKNVAEAEANGFNPERNAYSAVAQRLAESSKTLRTAQFLQNMLDRGIISKEAFPGMKASEIKPLSSFFTIAEKQPTGASPLAQALNESGAAFKPLTKLNDSGFSIPNELSKSAPRYRSNPLEFESPLDKAAYIVGNTTNRSARDADFIAALEKHTGLSESELRAYGQYMRSVVNGAANGVADGEKITVPRTLANLPEHGTNPSAAVAGEPNDFASLVKSLEQAQPADKIVKVNPYYIRPADEAAINEFLNPTKPSGLLGVANKLNSLYNKGFLLNPLPHMHNVTTNGMLLGGAKPEYVSQAFQDIKNGVSNPWYEEAVRAGAVSGLRGENLMKSVNDAMVPTKGLPGQLLDKFNYARHDALWDTDSAIRTALYRQAREEGLSSADAAARTNKFMVDYNNITPFEAKYIKPIVPFYAWKKGNIPLQISQTFAQTPKYVAYQHAKDSVSQALSGQPTDQKGRIMTGETLPDGSQVALDPYSPMDEPGKIMEKGLVSWLLGSLNPFIREPIVQGTSAIGEFAPNNPLGIQNKYSIYNAGAPEEYNARKGIAHALNALNPLGSSAILGEIGNSSNGINNSVNWIADLLGGNPANDLPTKDKPGQTTSELVTKLLGGFTGRDNPQKDAINQMYQNKGNILGQIKYLRETGQPVPKALQRQAYKRIPKAN